MAGMKDYAGMMPASMNPNEAMAGGGSPTGVMKNVDRVREAIMEELENRGLFNEVSNDAEMQEVLSLVENLVQALIKGDQQAVEQNPLTQVLAAQPVQGAQGAAPMPQGPQGGGMPGGGMPGPGGM